MSLSILLKNSSFVLSKRLVGSVATAHDVLKANGEISAVSELKNGLKIASHTSHKNTATVGVWIDSGTRYENDDNNGVASLFEHIIYSGTTKRTAAQLQNELAKIGARLKSFTSREHTAYYAECLSGDVEKVVEILADVMRNFKLEDSKIEEQRAHLKQKVEDLDNDYKASVFDNLHKTAFQGTSMSLPLLGSHASLDKITKKDILEFVDDHYKPVRMVLTGAGNVDHEQLTKLGEKYFGDLNNEYKQKIPSSSGVRFTGSEFLYRDDSYPHVYGAVAVEGVPRSHIDALALQIAQTHVGSWYQGHPLSINHPSPLVQRLCTNPELIKFEAFNFNYDHTGLFGVYLEARGDDDFPLNLIVTRVQKEWKHLAYGITDDQADRSKNLLKTNLFQLLENNTNLANHIASEVLSTGKITSLDVLERKIHYVDSAAIREAVSRHVYDRDLAVAAVGRTEAWPGYCPLRFGMSWWRL